MPEVNPAEALIIDEYLSNGGNKSAAFRKFNPKTAYSSSSGNFNKLLAKPEVTAYLQQRQAELSEASSIKSLDILRTLKEWLYADPTQYIGLTPDEIKELPPEVRQCIQDIDYKVKTYTDRNGREITEQHCKVKLVSKTDTIEKINKHLGFYSADNKQKGINVNMLLQSFTKDNPEQAYSLLQALEVANITNKEG